MLKLDASMHQTSLDGMLEAFFRPVERDGFWLEKEGRIARALHYTVDDSGKRQWTPNLEERFRYGPMALMGTAMWRKSKIGTDKYDEHIRRNMAYYRDTLQNLETLQKVPSYGAGPLIYAAAHLSDLWPEERLDEMATSLTEFSVRNYDFRFNEDSLVLMGMAALGDRLSDEHRSKMHDGAKSLRAIQDGKGLYRAKEHLQALRHQNQMYTIWGLAHSDMAAGQDDSAEGIRHCLEYTIAHRMQDDGALLWHNYRNVVHKLYSDCQSIFFGRVPERERLFSCHQAFFMYAVQAYRDLVNDKNAFADAFDNALRWQYGQNVTGKNLFELNGIGVPTRIVLTSGETETPVDKWVGIYEIGAMIMCMVKLLDDTQRG